MRRRWFVEAALLLMGGCKHVNPADYNEKQATNAPIIQPSSQQYPMDAAFSRRLNRVLKKVTVDVQTCYKLALKRDRNVKGNVLIQWTIDMQGRAREVRTVKDTLHFTPLRLCIETSIARKKFPLVEKPTTVQKSFTFNSTQ
ncbi:MAG: AgmX/PglI C-terminal domain-containing protein [Myxococcota bacterium]